MTAEVAVQFTATSNGIDAAAANGAAAIKKLDDAVKTTSENMKKAAASAHGFSLTTAGALREMIVLGHEVVSGRFSAIPGSMMVMAERAGGLETGVKALAEAFKNPLVLGVTAATAAFGIFALTALHTEENVSRIGVSLAATGQAGMFTAEEIKKFTTDLSKVAGVSKSEAVEGFQNLAGAIDLSTEKFTKLYKLLPDVAAGMRTDVPSAAKILAETMNDPDRAMETLQKRFNLLSVAQLELFQQFRLAGDKEGEQVILIEALTDRFTGLNAQIVTASRNLYSWWQYLIGTNDEMSKSDRIAMAWGKNTSGYKAAKEEEDTAKDKDMTWINAQIATQKRVQNDQVKEAILLQTQLNDHVDRQARALAQVNTLQKGINSANALGNTAEATKLQASLNSLQEKISRDERQENERRLREFRASNTEKIEGEKQYAQEMFSLEEQRTNLEYSMGKISAERQMTVLLQLKTQEYEAEMQALQKQLKLWDVGTQQYIHIQNEMTKATLKAENERMRIQSDAMKKTEQEWKQRTQTITSTVDGMLRGMMSGTQTWADTVRAAGQNVFIGFVNGAIRMGMKWAEAESVKTAATATGNAARVASDQTAASASGGFNAAKIIKEIAGDAARTYAGVFGFLSPAMGPFAAIPAGAAAVLVAGMQALVPSFDVGTNFVPNDTLAMVHKGERIIPAADNAQLMDAMNGGGGGQAMQLHVHMNGNVYGFKNFQQAVAQAVGSGMRNFNPALTKNLK